MNKLAIATIITALILETGAVSQTRTNPAQLVEPATPSYAERWCPGPVAVVAQSRKAATLGTNWSPGRPCYVHFNITPPAQVDPVSVTSFVEPVTISVSPTFTGDDEAYIYALAPTFNPVVPAKLRVSVRSPNSVTCPSCSGGVVTDPRQVRTFPPNSVPIGFIVIRGGLMSPKPDILLDQHQVYIGPGAEMVLRVDQGGYWFEVGTPTATLAAMTQRTADLENARAATQIRSMLSRPTEAEHVQQLEGQISELRAQLAEMSARVPPTKEETDRLRFEFMDAAESIRMNMTSQVEHIREQVETAAYGLYSELDKVDRVDVPSDPDAPCDHPKKWAMDDKYIYRCTTPSLPPINTPRMEIQAGQARSGGWVRMPYDRKWRPRK